MTTNPILNELYDIRSRILSDHGDDLKAYLHAEFNRLKAEGHPIAKIAQRTIRRTEAAKSSDSAGEDQSSPLSDR